MCVLAALSQHVVDYLREPPGGSNVSFTISASLPAEPTYRRLPPRASRRSQQDISYAYPFTSPCASPLRSLSISKTTFANLPAEPARSNLLPLHLPIRLLPATSALEPFILILSMCPCASALPRRRVLFPPFMHVCVGGCRHGSTALLV